MDKIQSLISEMGTRVDTLITELNRLKKENEHLVSQLNKVSEDIDSKNNSLTHLQQRIDELETQSVKENQSVFSEDVKKEIDSILEEIEQCLVLMNK